MNSNFQQVVQALGVLHNGASDPAQRKAAHEQCEALKWHSEPTAVAELAVQMSASEHPAQVRHFGLHLVEHLVRYRWKELSGIQEHFKQWILQYLLAGTLDAATELHFVKEKSAAIASNIASREWPQRWPNFLDVLMEAAAQGPTQSDLVVRTVRALVGTVYIDGNFVERRRNELKQALTQEFPRMLALLHGQLSMHHQQLQAGQQGEQCLQQCLQCLLELMPFVAPNVLAENLQQLGTHEVCAALMRAGQSDTRVQTCEYFAQLVSRRLSFWLGE